MSREPKQKVSLLPIADRPRPHRVDLKVRTLNDAGLWESEIKRIELAAQWADYPRYPRLEIFEAALVEYGREKVVKLVCRFYPRGDICFVGWLIALLDKRLDIATATAFRTAKAPEEVECIHTRPRTSCYMVNRNLFVEYDPDSRSRTPTIKTLFGNKIRLPANIAAMLEAGHLPLGSDSIPPGLIVFPRPRSIFEVFTTDGSLVEVIKNREESSAQHWGKWGLIAVKFGIGGKYKFQAILYGRGKVATLALQRTAVRSYPRDNFEAVSYDAKRETFYWLGHRPLAAKTSGLFRNEIRCVDKALGSLATIAVERGAQPLPELVLRHFLREDAISRDFLNGVLGVPGHWTSFAQEWGAEAWSPK